LSKDKPILSVAVTYARNSGSIRFMWIFAVVLWRGGMMQQWAVANAIFQCFLFKGFRIKAISII